MPVTKAAVRTHGPAMDPRRTNQPRSSPSSPTPFAASPSPGPSSFPPSRQNSSGSSHDDPPHRHRHRHHRFRHAYESNSEADRTHLCTAAVPSQAPSRPPLRSTHTWHARDPVAASVPYDTSALPLPSPSLKPHVPLYAPPPRSPHRGHHQRPHHEHEHHHEHQHPHTRAHHHPHRHRDGHCHKTSGDLTTSSALMPASAWSASPLPAVAYDHQVSSQQMKTAPKSSRADDDRRTSPLMAAGAAVSPTAGRRLDLTTPVNPDNIFGLAVFTASRPWDRDRQALMDTTAGLILDDHPLAHATSSSAAALRGLPLKTVHHDGLAPSNADAAPPRACNAPAPSQCGDYFVEAMSLLDLLASWRALRPHWSYGAGSVVPPCSDRRRLLNLAWRRWAQSRNRAPLYPAHRLVWQRQVDFAPMYGPLYRSPRSPQASVAPASTSSSTSTASSAASSSVRAVSATTDARHHAPLRSCLRQPRSSHNGSLSSCSLASILDSYRLPINGDRNNHMGHRDRHSGHANGHGSGQGSDSSLETSSNSRSPSNREANHTRLETAVPSSTFSPSPAPSAASPISELNQPSAAPTIPGPTLARRSPRPSSSWPMRRRSVSNATPPPRALDGGRFGLPAVTSAKPRRVSFNHIVDQHVFDEWIVAIDNARLPATFTTVRATVAIATHATAASRTPVALPARPPPAWMPPADLVAQSASHSEAVVPTTSAAFPTPASSQTVSPVLGHGSGRPAKEDAAPPTARPSVQRDADDAVSCSSPPDSPDSGKQTKPSGAQCVSPAPYPAPRPSTRSSPSPHVAAPAASGSAPHPSPPSWGSSQSDPHDSRCEHLQNNSCQARDVGLGVMPYPADQRHCPAPSDRGAMHAQHDFHRDDALASETSLSTVLPSEARVMIAALPSPPLEQGSDREPLFPVALSAPAPSPRRPRLRDHHRLLDEDEDDDGVDGTVAVLGWGFFPPDTVCRPATPPLSAERLETDRRFVTARATWTRETTRATPLSVDAAFSPAPTEKKIGVSVARTASSSEDGASPPVPSAFGHVDILSRSRQHHAAAMDEVLLTNAFFVHPDLIPNGSAWYPDRIPAHHHARHHRDHRCRHRLDNRDAGSPSFVASGSTSDDAAMMPLRHIPPSSLQASAERIDKPSLRRDVLPRRSPTTALMLLGWRLALTVSIVVLGWLNTTVDTWLPRFQRFIPGASDRSWVTSTTSAHADATRSSTFASTSRSSPAARDVGGSWSSLTSSSSSSLVSASSAVSLNEGSAWNCAAARPTRTDPSLPELLHVLHRHLQFALAATSGMGDLVVGVLDASSEDESETERRRGRQPAPAVAPVSTMAMMRLVTDVIDIGFEVEKHVHHAIARATNDVPLLARRGLDLWCMGFDLN
ncbi:hypothetical protein CXG81DRAFT_17388 [Caulochytrium protostelioides]|uniref:Uncharacterized protein n=1 Tax=Caulochytrium protostelioides TaxID=1555241 RepID=A0A4P9XC66_9FUNG|nr:hypothetical protein CXG81DRAFT_17388 [Caulochytrium protostelioides]|eukprot:RKP03034.1 hypothetical protein CXG81DRAFT_17388 [Caulochytrium protostelioides]